MKLKVNHKELAKINDVVINDANYLNEQFDYLLVQITELRSVWQGTDANEFCNNAESYIRFLKTVPKIYNSLYQVIGKSDNRYQEIDKESALNMKKAVVEHE